ncbi:ATP-binding cassette domain-containing protein [Mycoplasma leonicaptivi]|uniref:ATP-binding cassette domain-containing protein n=1 Tax=Mycoplasma leonicaptivi TaxID=36742 RepID=UPI0006888993|nr:ABC transporter ATP-binding protein [Mycoplasma leonicaptivi]
MIKFENTSLNYDKKITVLKNIDLTFEKGKIYGLIGKSGCGKTTLLNSIFNWNLIKEGNLYLDSNNIKLIKNKKKIKNQISYIQAQSNLIDEISFYDNFLLVFKHYKNFLYKFFKILTKNQKKELFKNLQLVNMHEFIFKNIGELSSGQKQRMLFVLNNMQKPNILLCDEPTSNLDEINTNLVYQEIIKEKHDRVTIIAIHDLSAAIKYCDVLIAIKNGNIEKVYETKPKNKKELLEYFDL